MQLSSLPLRVAGCPESAAMPSTSKPAFTAALTPAPNRRNGQRSKLRPGSRNVTHAYDHDVVSSVSSLVSSGLVCAIGWQLLKQPEVLGNGTEQGDQVRKRSGSGSSSCLPLVVLCRGRLACIPFAPSAYLCNEMVSSSRGCRGHGSAPGSP